MAVGWRSACVESQQKVGEMAGRKGFGYGGKIQQLPINNNLLVTMTMTATTTAYSFQQQQQSIIYGVNPPGLEVDA